METFWDWATVLAFAGLVTLLLQRSLEDEPRDKLWHYFPPAGACAVINYLGNEGYPAFAIILSLAALAYVYFVLQVRLPNQKF